jgi:septal ring-binding cell division protein DamX
MRFEIRAGGAVLILVGLVGLSGAVFALGLIAGYEMARQNTVDTAQVASVFPVPAPPALEPTPAAAAPEAESSPAAAPSIAALAPAAHPRSFKSFAPAALTTPAARMPELAHPIAAASPRTVANAEPSPALRRHPFNIQIDAVMDRAGADDMMRRLRALGFPSTETATSLNGQTWYRVSVGPYATQDEAQAAQEKLHQQYRATYNGH